ncbi:MAG: hypothetical protein QM500_12160 [Methylococcales bacterium]
MTIHAYYDTFKYRAALICAQISADEDLEVKAFGYDDYAGWSHCSSGDEFGVASLSDMIFVHPQNKSKN